MVRTGPTATRREKMCSPVDAPGGRPERRMQRLWVVRLPLLPGQPARPVRRRASLRWDASGGVAGAHRPLDGRRASGNLPLRCL